MEANKIMKARLKVIKSDATIEEYLHTKVMHTISRVLDGIGQADITTAESLSEVVTYYLYQRHGESVIPSSEVLSVVKVSLASVGFEAAAEALTEHYYQRKIRRSRTEVVHINLAEASEAEIFLGDVVALEKSPWDKSVIIEDLAVGQGIDRSIAR
ncbi:MAG: hypothetical protein WC962_04965, partial [Phycisphaerae bacterium]